MNFSIDKVKTPKGDARFEVRAWDGSGESRVEWKRRFATRKDAQNFVDDQLYQERKAKKELKESGGDPLTVTTFGAECEYWLRTKAPQFSPGWRVNVDRLRSEFQDRLDSLRVKDITTKLLREIETELRAKGNSPQTIRHKIGFIKGVLNHSVASERLPYSPIAKYRAPKVPKPDIEFWEKDEALSFLSFALKKYPKGSFDHRNYLIYETGLNTLVRAGELWGMKVNSLKPSLNVIYVAEQYDRVKRVFRQLKGKEARNVPLNDTVKANLLDWIKSQGLGPNDVLFPSTTGKPMDHDNFKNRIFDRDVAEWSEETGGRVIKFHGLRHTGATLMLDSGVQLRVLQAILGHKDIQTTEGYAHALGRSIQTAAATFTLSPTSAPVQSTPPPAPQSPAAETSTSKPAASDRRAHLRVV